MEKTLNDLITLVASCGQVIRDLYNAPTAPTVDTKPDRTPVTAADRQANKILVEGLQNMRPQFPVVTEEADLPPYGTRKGWQKFWLIDPLDGTREFIAKTGEFTINIALIENFQPVLGLVFVPLTQELYFAVKGGGAYKQLDDMTLRQLRTRPLSDDAVTCYLSRHHRQGEDKKLKTLWPAIEIATLGSALKFCRVAEGQADFYLRLAPTSEWDTAAGQCILEEAGGHVLNPEGMPLDYNKENILNGNFIAFGDPLLEWEKMFS